MRHPAKHAAAPDRELIQFRVPAGYGNRLNELARNNFQSRSGFLEKLVTGLVDQNETHGAGAAAQPQTT